MEVRTRAPSLHAEGTDPTPSGGRCSEFTREPVRGNHTGVLRSGHRLTTSRTPWDRCHFIEARSPDGAHPKFRDGICSIARWSSALSRQESKLLLV